jgi:hypothetical protein
VDRRSLAACVLSAHPRAEVLGIVRPAFVEARVAACVRAHASVGDVQR